MLMEPILNEKNFPRFLKKYVKKLEDVVLDAKEFESVLERLFGLKEKNWNDATKKLAGTLFFAAAEGYLEEELFKLKHNFRASFILPPE